MPSHRAHTYVDRQIFGKSYWKVHSNMDKPYLWMGRNHRKWFHTPVWSRAIAQKCYPDDYRALLAGYYHITIDRLCTENPGFKANLEFLAYMDAKKRKEMRTNRDKRKSASRRQQRSNEVRPIQRSFWNIEDLEKFVKQVKRINDMHKR